MKDYFRIWLLPLMLVMIMVGCKRDRGGLIISPEDGTFPTVSSTDPVDAATEVILTQPISATFSKPMDGASLTMTVFTLMQDTTSIPGIVSYADTTAIFTPENILNHYTTFTATITTGARDVAGKALVTDYVWSFTTGGPLLGASCSSCHD